MRLHRVTGGGFGSERELSLAARGTYRAPLICEDALGWEATVLWLGS